MTRIDGIDNQQQFSSKSIKKLILTGCNLKEVNSTNFGQLHALEEVVKKANIYFNFKFLVRFACKSH